MKEIQTILREATRLAEASVKCVLATVVDVQGSGYRLPGARMLISEGGETFGTVSGGCLESDVLERARRVLRDGSPAVLTYDTRGAADSVFSLNMGCNGVVRILLEPVENNTLFEFVRNAIGRRRPAVAATLISATNELKYRPGSRYLFDELPAGSGEGVDALRRKLSVDVKEILGGGGRSECRTYEVEGETAEFFLEVIRPPVKLVIFGAGHDAVPVAEFAKQLGWHVCVVDHRPAFAAAARFPHADEIFLLRPENLDGNVAADENSAAVVMTHNYTLDREILKFALAEPFAYLGALGPRRRTENLLQELRAQGQIVDESRLKKLYAPVGLDIGGTNPETIALSIVAEIQSVLSDRAGGFLKNRQGSIYDRPRQR